MTEQTLQQTCLASFSLIMKQYSFNTLIAAILCLLAPACFSQSAESNYKLKAGDSIAMRIFQEPDMATASRVTSEGTVYFPLVGSLQVAGKTLPELQEELFELYNADYFVNPQLAIQITEYAPLRVRVRGRVNRPGFVVIPPEESFTVMDVIAAAGDIAANGNDRRVELHRTDARGDTQIIVIDLSGNGKSSPDPSTLFVQENDAIVVPEKLF